MRMLRTLREMVVDPHRSQMNPLFLGVVGMVLVAAVLMAAVALPRGWYTFRTGEFAAEFTNAAGLSTADPVYVAGVPAGRVESVDLDGDHVTVTFRLDKDQPLGDETTAGIKYRTVLGKLYLDIRPGGDGEIGGGSVGKDDTIPVSRTSVPYSLDEIAADTQRTATELDVTGLEEMMRTLNNVLPDSSATKDALAGVSAVAGTISRNGDRIAQLLDTSRYLSDLVAGQTDSLVALLDNADIVLGTIASRRDAMLQLVEDLKLLVRQASQFLVENDESLNRLLTNVRSVMGTLRENAGNIDELMTKLPPALRAATDASGNGTWMDVSAPAGPVADNLLCVLQVMKECR